jgi:hypothetical protein
MHIAIWIVTLLLVGLWTLASWGLSRLLAMDGSWVSQIEPWLARMPFGGWLETWFPDWLQVAQVSLDALQAALGWLGATAPLLVWVVWGGGALLLMLAGAALSLLVALIRRTMPPSPPAGQPPMTAV